MMSVKAEQEYDYDLFTIGAGSGGVRASRMSTQYGVKVAVRVVSPPPSHFRGYAHHSRRGCLTRWQTRCREAATSPGTSPREGMARRNVCASAC
jgi:hypothetical protein